MLKVVMGCEVVFVSFLLVLTEEVVDGVCSELGMCPVGFLWVLS